MVKSVLFDLFGTLLVYDHARLGKSYAKTEALAASFNYPVLPSNDFLTSLDQCFLAFEQRCDEDQIEFSMQAVIAACFDGKNIALEEHQLDVLAESYCREWSAAILPVEGVENFLSNLGKQYQLGIITNTHFAPMVYRLLEQFKLTQYFKLVVTSVEHGFAKPHASIFEKALRELSVKAEEAVFVGDSLTADYQGATALGIESYLIGKSARVAPQYQITSVVDLPRYRF